MPFTKTRNRFIMLFIVGGGGRCQSVIPRNNNNGTGGAVATERTCGFANGNRSTNGHNEGKRVSPLATESSLLFGQLDRVEEEGAKDAIFSSPDRRNIRRGRKEVKDKGGPISCHKNKIETD